jgi:nucleoside-diphosphate-sugar epimerase
MVTGHLGYIGTILTSYFVDAGYDVIGLDTDLYDGCTFLNSVPEIPFIKKDVRDVEVGDFENIDAIIHLAALSNDPLGNLNPELTFDINYRATVHLAELAKKAGVSRFLFSSSCSNYGAGGDDFLDESASFNPVTPYGESKVLAERGLSKLASNKFSPVFLRNATAYGLSPRIRFDLVVNNLVAWAVSTGKIYLKSDGSPWRPLIHIEDMAHAFLSILEAPNDKIHNEAFNIGSTEENYRIRDVAKIVAEVVPNCELSFAPQAGPDLRNYRVNCEKIKKVLPSFQPKWTVKKGVFELYNAFKDANLSPEVFEGPQFKRILHIQKLLDTGKLSSKLFWND